ncbi:MAG: glutaredoxin family protein [Nitrospirae bacterium]|nr:glutaredoxin family protein [Nitrospirota bacterium]
MTKKVTVYTLSTCPVCKKVKKFLEENGISYTLIEVDTLDGSEQWAATRELAKHNPQASYPTTVVEDVISGYDIDALRGKLQ